MKILLIQPSARIKAGNSRVIPLGLAYIASVLMEDGHSVKVVDEQINENRPKDYDLVGMTATTPLITRAWELAKELKEGNPNCNIVIGGPHVSALPEESLQHVDVVVRMEGEETIKELCNKLERGETLKAVRGISYKKDGKIRHNPDRKYIDNLDEIPFPAFELFDLKKYQPIQPLLTTNKSLNIMTSRGCPFNCNFCYKGVFGHKYRTRSVDNIVEEWSWIIEKFEIEEIGIQDDMFNIDKKRVIKLCEKLRSERLDTPWSTPNGIRVDLTNREILRAMKSSGCYRIAHGIEHGNQAMLDKVGKGITLQQVRDAVKKAKELGLVVTGFFILGNIYETKITMRQTINFACSLPIDYAQFMIATPFPGTRLYEEVKNNCRLLVNSWDEYSQFESKCYFECGELKKNIVERMFKIAYRKFYMRPNYIARILASNMTNLPNLINGVLHYFL